MGWTALCPTANDHNDDNYNNHHDDYDYDDHDCSVDFSFNDVDHVDKLDNHVDDINHLDLYHVDNHNDHDDDSVSHRLG